MKKVTKILALALVLVMAVCSFAACGSDKDSVEKTVKGYIEAVKDMDFEKAMDYCGGELYDEAKESMGEMESQMGDYGEVYKSVMEDLEYEIGDIKIDGDEATAEFTMSVMGQEESGELLLEKIDGKWKIVGGDAI